MLIEQTSGMTTLSLRPDPSAMIGNAEEMVTRLSGGLATCAGERAQQQLLDRM